jgi:hypothetical protein
MPRELIDTGTDKRFVRGAEACRFKESVAVGRSLAAETASAPKPSPGKAEATAAIASHRGSTSPPIIVPLAGVETGPSACSSA